MYILLRVSFLENCVWIWALFETGTGNGRGQKSGTEAAGGQVLCSGSPLLGVPRQSHTTWCSFSEAVRTTPSVCFWKTLFQQLFISLGCPFCLLSDCLRSGKNAGYLWETVETIPAPTLTVLHLESSGRGGCGSFRARGEAGSGDFVGICILGSMSEYPLASRTWGEGGVLITPFKFVSTFSEEDMLRARPAVWQNAEESKHGLSVG